MKQLPTLAAIVTLLTACHDETPNMDVSQRCIEDFKAMGIKMVHPSDSFPECFKVSRADYVKYVRPIVDKHNYTYSCTYDTITNACRVCVLGPGPLLKQ